MDFLPPFITVDETWVHRYTRDVKEKLKKWTAKHEQFLSKAKAIPSAEKVMTTDF